MKWIKRWSTKPRFWLIENHLVKKVPKLHEEQVEEHREIIREVRQSKKDVSRDLADTLLRLDAVTDNLESTLWDLRTKRITEGE